MTYIKPTEAAKLFRSRGNKIYSSFTSASKALSKTSGRTAIMGIGGGKYIIKRV